MGKKINSTNNFPSTVPASNDRVLGVDISDTSNDANGEVVSFTAQSIADLASYTVTEADVTAHEAALTITEDQISDLGSYITDIVSDTTPQLGGNLDVNGKKITSTDNGNIDIEPNGTGDVLLGNFTFDADQTVGAGQDDYVLTYDNASGKISLEEAGGGGGLVPISTTTASSDAAVDISLTGGYTRYRIYFRGVAPANDNTELRGRLSVDGGSTYEDGTNVYDQTVSRISGGSGDNANASTYFIIDQTVGNSTDEEVNGWVEITLPSGGGGSRNTTLSFAHARDNFANFHITAGGCILTSTTTDATDVRFYFSSGNISSGTFDLYGISGVA